MESNTTPPQPQKPFRQINGRRQDRQNQQAAYRTVYESDTPVEAAHRQGTRPDSAILNEDNHIMIIF